MPINLANKIKIEVHYIVITYILKMGIFFAKITHTRKNILRAVALRVPVKFIFKVLAKNVISL